MNPKSQAIWLIWHLRAGKRHDLAVLQGHDDPPLIIDSRSRPHGGCGKTLPPEVRTSGRIDARQERRMGRIVARVAGDQECAGRHDKTVETAARRVGP